MRFGILLVGGVVTATAATIVLHDRGDGVGAIELASFGPSIEWVSDAVAYRDPDYDFTMAVPAGWRPLVAIGDSGEADAGSDRVADPGADLGYTIGFEAPRDGGHDVFADYVMVEILPGSSSGRFETDGLRERPVVIDGLPGTREQLAIDDHDLGDDVLDLVVYQAEVRGLGFTVGFYAIGERSRRALLDDAFELMIRTFDLELPPFRVSARPSVTSDGASPGSA